MKSLFVRFTFLILVAQLFAATAYAAPFSILKPAKLTIPADIEKVFIDPQWVDATNDALEIKNQALRTLRDRLNQLGRFTVFLGPPRDFDPNRETVAVIQGSVVSSAEVIQGQFTEKGECRGGFSGIAGALTAREKTEQGITFSRRGMLCKRPELSSRLVEAGITAGLSMLGVNEYPRLDEVIRVYKYRNIALFAQVNLSLTQIGDVRQTLAITAEAASFARHIVNPDTYRNVRESGDNAPLIWLWFRFSPVAPVVIRDIGIVSASNPGSFLADHYQRFTPSVADISVEERYRIISGLVDNTLVEFINTISPYRTQVEIPIASGGNDEAREKLEGGEYDEVKELLKEPQDPADFYNLGLAYEAGARSVRDYEDALFYYTRAFEASPGEMIFARGIGRMEFQLKAANRLRNQSALTRE